MDGGGPGDAALGQQLNDAAEHGTIERVGVGALPDQDVAVDSRDGRQKMTEEMVAPLGVDSTNNAVMNNATIVGGAAVAGGVAGGLGAVAVVETVVAAVGFTASGIAAGSTAATMMSTAAIANGGAVGAGSAVAVLQSIGAAGLGALAGPVMFVGGILSASVIGLSAYLIAGRIKPLPGEERPSTTAAQAKKEAEEREAAAAAEREGARAAHDAAVQTGIDNVQRDVTMEEGLDLAGEKGSILQSQTPSSDSVSGLTEEDLEKFRREQQARLKAEAQLARTNDQLDAYKDLVALLLQNPANQAIFEQFQHQDQPPASGENSTRQVV